MARIRENNAAASTLKTVGKVEKVTVVKATHIIPIPKPFIIVIHITSSIPTSAFQLVIQRLLTPTHNKPKRIRNFPDIKLNKNPEHNMAPIVPSPREEITQPAESTGYPCTF